MDLKQRQKTSVKIRWFKSLDSSLFMSSSSESNSLEKNNRNRREEQKESTIQFLPGFLPAVYLSPGSGLNAALGQKPPTSFADVTKVGAGEKQTHLSVCLHGSYSVLTLLPAFCLGMLPRIGFADLP